MSAYIPTEADREKAAELMRHTLALMSQKAAPAPEPSPEPREASRGQLSRVPCVCRECGQPFDAMVMEVLGFRVQQQACEPCVAADRERRAEKERPTLSSFEAAWNAFCPADYRDTDEAQLRAAVHQRGIALDKVDQVLGWKPGKGGLALIGETRRHKSRLMFLLMKRLMREGRQLRYLNSANFADELGASYENGPSAAEEWIRKVERVDVLFIDDLGKEKRTERGAVALYRIAEYRNANRKDTFYTSNLGRQGLADSWKMAARKGDFFDTHAEPTAERFGELCRSIQL